MSGMQLRAELKSAYWYLCDERASAAGHRSDFRASLARTLCHEGRPALAGGGLLSLSPFTGRRWPREAGPVRGLGPPHRLCPSSGSQLALLATFSPQAGRRKESSISLRTSLPVAHSIGIPPRC